MKNSLLFYSTREELNDLLNQWIDRFGLHVVGKTFSPQTRVLISKNLDPRSKGQMSLTRFDELILGTDLERLSVFGSTPKSFEYPPGIRVMFPALTANGLREGSLDLIEKNPMNRDLWKGVVADIRRMTTTGMWVFSPFNRGKMFSRDLIYTRGIAEFVRQGGRLLPFAGENLVTIDEPHGQTPGDPGGSVSGHRIPD